MIRKVHHIGVAVKDLEESADFFQESFGVPASETDYFGELAFSFLPLEGTNIELLQSTTEDGTIAKFIQKNGTGVHHIAFAVEDIQKELDHLKAKGLRLINETPYRNAHGDLVAFIHPKSTYGVLIELIESQSEAHT